MIEGLEGIKKQVGYQIDIAMAKRTNGVKKIALKLCTLLKERRFQ